MNVWVTATVRFAAVAPDDYLAAEQWADRITDAITEAIPPLDYSIEDDSASVIDWTTVEVEPISRKDADA